MIAMLWCPLFFVSGSSDQLSSSERVQCYKGLTREQQWGRKVSLCMYMVCKSCQINQAILLPPTSLLSLSQTFLVSLPLSLPVQMCGLYVWFWWGWESDYTALCPWISPEVYQLLAEGKLIVCNITKNRLGCTRIIEYSSKCPPLLPQKVCKKEGGACFGVLMVTPRFYT